MKHHIIIQFPHILERPKMDLFILQHFEFYFDKTPEMRRVRPGMLEYRFNGLISDEDMDLIREVITIDFPFVWVSRSYLKSPYEDGNPKERRSGIGWRMYTDGVRRSRFYPTDTVPEGWELCVKPVVKKPRVKMKWITNGVNISKIPVDKEVPEGWRLGKTRDK